jgi:hypothetical protein
MFTAAKKQKQKKKKKKKKKKTETKLYKILPVVLYGYEYWSLTLREEQRLRVFENRVLRNIFGPKREQLIGECRRPKDEELHDLYSSTNIIRVTNQLRIRWAGHVEHTGQRGIQGFSGDTSGKETTWKTYV